MSDVNSAHARYSPPQSAPAGGTAATVPHQPSGYVGYTPPPAVADRSGGGNPSGSPTLDPALLNDPIMSDIMLDAIFQRAFKSDADSLRGRMLTGGQERERLQAKARDAIARAAREAAKAQKLSMINKVFGWIAKIATIIAAAFAMVAALAAAPLSGGLSLIVCAACATLLVMAVVDLAGAISAECGGPAFSTGQYLTQGLSKMLQSMGMSKEDADELGGKLALALVILIMVISFCGMGAGAAPALMSSVFRFGTKAASTGAAAKTGSAAASTTQAGSGTAASTTKGTAAAKTVTTASTASTAAQNAANAATQALRAPSTGAYLRLMAKMEMKWATMRWQAPTIEGLTAVVSGSAAVGQGVTEIQVAKIKFKREEILVDKMKIDAYLEVVKKDINDVTELFKRHNDTKTHYFEMRKQMRESDWDTESFITGNLA